MTPELTVLALAGVWQFAQFVIMAIPLNMQLGADKTAGPRDEPLEPKGVPARLHRAFSNHFEALILFAIAVVVVTLGEKSSAFTAGCAWTYLAARVLYVPAYASGVPYLRSAVFTVGWLATLAMLIAALL